MRKFRPLKDLLDIIYPETCLACDNPLVAGEELICLPCISEFPKTDFHHIKENKVVQTFKGRCLFQKASSWLYFTKGGKVQSMMHALKYRGRTDIGHKLGTMLARELSQSDFFADIDLLVPVPLHPKKFKKRGYNQSAILALAISEITNIPISENNLTRTHFNQTQTRKSRFSRWLNVKTIFDIGEPEKFQNRHLLLIDDVVTTGSTIEACVIKLENIKGIRISLLTLAIAQ